MIDLHSHTWLSDGELSPAALVERAQQRGVRQLAITDHDSIAAHRELALQQLPSDLELLSGVEISANWEGREIHIVGLLIDLDDSGLNPLLTRQQQHRRERAADIGLQLERAGITGLASYLEQLPCESVGRSHIAGFLVESGHVGSKQQAFSKYLGKRGKLQTSVPWCSMEEAVSTLRAAGGISVLAHPDRYAFNRARLRRLLMEFAACGGDALEVSYSNLHPEKLAMLGALALETGLWASVGSDFHTPENSWMDLGRIRQLPPACAEKAIWYHPRWRAELPANVPAAPGTSL